MPENVHGELHKEIAPSQKSSKNRKTIANFYFKFNE